CSTSSSERPPDPGRRRARFWETQLARIRRGVRQSSSSSEGSGRMRRQITGTLGTVLAVGLTLATSVALAAPRATGKETFRGVVVASGESDARSVVTSLIVARGVFAGGGRIVEIASRPGD